MSHPPRPPPRHDEPIQLDLAPGPLIKRRPTWVTTLGVLGIIWGVVEVLGAISTPIVIMMNRVQQQMFANPAFWAAMSQPAAGVATTSFAVGPGQFTGRVTVQTGGSLPTTLPAGPPGMPPAMPAALRRMFQQPAWYESVMIANGVQSLLAGALLLVGSIKLLSEKRSARGWLLAANWASLAALGALIVLATIDASMTTLSYVGCSFFCLPLPIVFLVFLYLPSSRAWFDGLAKA